LIDDPDHLNWFYMKVLGKYIGPARDKVAAPNSPLLLHSTYHESFLFTVSA
jgi:hypothetical protein